MNGCGNKKLPVEYILHEEQVYSLLNETVYDFNNMKLRLEITETKNRYAEKCYWIVNLLCDKDSLIDQYRIMLDEDIIEMKKSALKHFIKQAERKL